MPFINMALGDVGEQYAAPTGVYNLQVLKAEEQASKAHKEEHGEDAEPNMLVVTIGIQSDEHPDAAPFREWFTYPEEGGEYNEMRIRELKRFLYWFNVPFEDNGFNTEDLEGATAEGITVKKEVNENSGREFNSMELDPIPSEDGEEDAGGDEGVAEEEAAPEEEVAEEEVAEEEVVEEEVVDEEPEPEPAPARRTTSARPAARPAAKTATRAAPKAAAKAAPKAAAKTAAKGKGRR